MAAENEAKIILGAEDNATPTLEKLISTLDKLDKKLGQSSDEVQKSASSMKGAFDAIGKAGLGLSASLTAPLVLLGKTMVSQVGNIEQLKISFDTMLGSAQKGSTVLKQVADFAAKTPFDLPQVSAGAKSLLAYGFAAGDLIPKLKQIGDVASGVGAPLGDLIYLFGTLRASGRVTNIDLIQFAGRGIPIFEELSKVLGVSTDKIRGLAKDGKIQFKDVEKAFAGMTGEGGKFFNLMENQSKTFQGSLSNLRDNFVRVSLSLLGLSTDAETYGQVIEGGLFDRLRDGIKTALDAVDKLVKAFSAMSPTTKQAIIDFGLLLAILGPTALAFTALISPVGLAIAAIVALSAALVTGKKYLADFVNEGIDLQFINDLNEGMKDSVTELEKVNQAKVDNLNETIEKMKIAYDKMGDDQKETQGRIAKTNIDQAIKERNLLIENAILQKNELIKQAVIQATAVNGVYDVQNNRILVGWDKFSFKLKGAIKETLLNMGSQFHAAGGFIVDVLGRAVDAIIQNFKDAFSNIKSLFTATSFDELKTSLTKLFTDPVKTSLKVLPDAYADFKKRLDEVGAATEKHSRERLESEGSLLPDTKAAYEKAIKDADKAGKDISDALLAGMSKAPNLGSPVDGKEAKKKEDALKKMVVELGKSLEDFGVFSVRLGGKIVATFNDAAEGIKKIKDQLGNIAKQSEEAIKQINDLEIKIQKGRGGVDVGEQPTNSYENLKEAVKEVENQVDELISKHKSFIKEAIDGVSKYRDEVKKVNDQAEADVKKAEDQAASDIGKGYADNLKEIDKTTQAIKDKEKDLLKVDNSKRYDELTEEIKLLKDRKIELDKNLESYKAIADGTFQVGDVVQEAQTNRNNLVLRPGVDTDEAAAKLESQIASAIKFKDLIQKGREILADQGLRKAQEEIADEEARRNLSEIDFIAYSTAKKIESIQLEKDAKLKALSDLNIVYQNISAGTVGNLDEEELKKQGFDQGAIDLVTKAKQEQAEFQTALDGKIIVLEQYKEKEKEIYTSATIELQNQQAILETYVAASLDRLVNKYKELQAAAIAAAAAQKSVLGVQSAPTSVTPTALPGHAMGGFTADIPPSAIAGIVHGGEWVAPKWMVDAMRPVFDALDVARTRGFADGGMVPAAAPSYNQPITMTNNINGNVDFMAAARHLAWQLRTR